MSAKLLLALAGLLVAKASVAAPEIGACLASLRPTAPSQRVSLADFDKFTANTKIIERTIAARANQAELKDTWWDYIAKAVDDERIEGGRRILTQHAAALATIEANYEVDRAAVVAVFGVESNYGARPGDIPVLDAWVTRACTEERALWRANVFASIRLLRDGIVDRASFTGSWGGAFGLTQFIPTSFESLAVDGDGDGRIDLYNSLPDAMASTANHLTRRVRWIAGVAPALEVRLPKGLASAVVPEVEQRLSQTQRSLRQWAQLGAIRADGAALQGEAGAHVFAPVGAAGPLFLVTANFDALLAYNNSTKYALAVSLLAQRMAGGSALVTPWPTDDPGLSRQQIRELQALLAARGHDVGKPDGIPGERTREAIRAEQQRLGLVVDGRAGQKVLAALRQP